MPAGERPNRHPPSHRRANRTGQLATQRVRRKPSCGPHRRSRSHRFPDSAEPHRVTSTVGRLIEPSERPVAFTSACEWPPSAACCCSTAEKSKLAARLDAAPTPSTDTSRSTLQTRPAHSQCSPSASPNRAASTASCNTKRRASPAAGCWPALAAAPLVESAAGRDEIPIVPVAANPLFAQAAPIRRIGTREPQAQTRIELVRESSAENEPISEASCSMSGST